jgi:hypothetical protein
MERLVNTSARRKALIIYWHCLLPSDWLQIMCNIHKTCGRLSPT